MVGIKTGVNSGLAKGGLTYFVETFVQGSAFVLLPTILLRQASRNHQLLVAAKRWWQA